ncbi:hypothetical protein ACFSMW_08995 [Virgibacillus halophilus]|uniref:Phr family secreted Rap phosphatase inhibitor n=1 Tax=Tigheibacillus halophilus TaxID=361280 RepID=A0ABU5C4R5_9BACI|nr:hypothetical protein [Virgibacillus halophilus]
MKKLLIAVFMLIILGFCVFGYAASNKPVTNDAVNEDGQTIITNLN